MNSIQLSKGYELTSPVLRDPTGNQLEQCRLLSQNVFKTINSKQKLAKPVSGLGHG